MSVDFIKTFVRAALASEKSGNILPSDIGRLQWLIMGLLDRFPAKERKFIWCWFRVATIFERMHSSSPAGEEEKHNLWQSVFEVLLVKNKYYPRGNHLTRTLEFQRDMLRTLTCQLNGQGAESWLKDEGFSMIAGLSLLPCYCEYPDRADRMYKKNVTSKLLSLYKKTVYDGEYDFHESLLLTILAVLHNTTTAAIRKRLTHPTA